MANNNHAHHLRPFLSKELRNVLVDIVLEQLEPHQDSFDSIAACGVSMLSISPIIAHLMNKQLVVVRKKTDKENNSGKIVEFVDKPERYIIIDDLVATGRTILYINDCMQKHASGQLVGVMPTYNLISCMMFNIDYGELGENFGNYQKYFYLDNVHVPYLHKDISRETFDKYSKVVRSVNDRINGVGVSNPT